MQDKYVGDVGDFGKYGLLRRLCAENLSPALCLGVVWYRVPSERGNDGKFTKYLEPTSRNRRRFEQCDPGLWTALRRIVCEKKTRTIEAIEASEILPTGTRFFSGQRDASIEAVRDCDIVFLDPDNGLETPSVPANHRSASKYVFLAHVQRFIEQEASLVIYHHLPQHRFASQEAAERIQQLRDLAVSHSCTALRYHRGTSRFFFIIEAPRHRETLRNRIGAFQESLWFNARHFSHAGGWS